MAKQSSGNATLTPKQKQFTEEYVKTGNAYESYIKVYNCKQKVAEASSSRLLSNVKVLEYIEELNKALMSPKIADMTEIKEFWTNTLRDTELDRKDRLKASEYIAKTNAAFIERQELAITEIPKITLKRG